MKTLVELPLLPLRDVVVYPHMVTLERKTGARGLRSILEGILLDTMYEIPSQQDVSKVVIDESVIDGSSQPLMIYENSEKPAKAAPEA